MFPWNKLYYYYYLKGTYIVSYIRVYTLASSANIPGNKKVKIRWVKTLFRQRYFVQLHNLVVGFWGCCPVVGWLFWWQVSRWQVTMPCNLPSNYAPSGPRLISHMVVTCSMILYSDLDYIIDNISWPCSFETINRYTSNELYGRKMFWFQT